MALHLLLLPVLLHTLVVSAQDDIPFNKTGFTDIYVNPDGSNSRHHSSYGCNTQTFLSPGNSSVFTSPGFPNPYPSYRTCQYIFKSLNLSCNIQIECSFIQLPSSSFCSFSTHLFIKWGFQRNERKCFCGTSTPPTVVSTSYWAYIRFTNRWRNRRGYRGFNCTATSICPSSTSAPTTMTSDVPTSGPTTAAPPTEAPTTNAPTTAAPTTVAPTTDAVTTAVPNTVAATTAAPTTAAPTTAAPTTVAATTAAPTTAAPTTAAPTTVVATAAATTSGAPTTP